VPWPLDLALFDGAVQHGPESAVRLLQAALRVSVDGVLGPQTRHAAATAPWRDVLAEYLVRRAELYLGITPPGPLRGWGRRLFDLCLEIGAGAQ
jgi:lysozyme family protein